MSCRLPQGIAQCYLLPDTSECTTLCSEFIYDRAELT